MASASVGNTSRGSFGSYFLKPHQHIPSRQSRHTPFRTAQRICNTHKSCCCRKPPSIQPPFYHLPNLPLWASSVHYQTELGRFCPSIRTKSIHASKITTPSARPHHAYRPIGFNMSIRKHTKQIGPLANSMRCKTCD